MSSPAYYTPLRYPGGKGKLAAYIKAIFEENDLVDGCYAEPFAGGSGVALELLFQEYVSKIYINDVSPSVAAFWRCVLNRTEDLCRLIRDKRVTMAEWHRQREIQSEGRSAGDLALGFSTFFLNRTNRSGILNAGVIGGQDQDGPWKIDARYNKPDLTQRIENIAAQRKRIFFSQLDAVDFIAGVAADMPAKSLTYLDPPYFVKGQDLYLHHYQPADHEVIAGLAPAVLAGKPWIVSYDNVREVRALYATFERITYRLGYSAREVRDGAEIMFFGPGLQIPAIRSPMKKAA